MGKAWIWVRVTCAHRLRWSDVLIDVGPVAAALGLWSAALGRVDLAEIGEYGLVTALPTTYFAAIGALSIGFAAALVRKRPARVLAAYVAVLVVLLHATAPLLYGTPRYSWAWKHIGIVDYILRHGATDPDARYLSANHNWPGFFLLVAQLLELAGFRSALGVATWSPLLFQALYFLIMPVLFRAFTRGPGLIWLSAWMFHAANWVGQEYFSPQAFGYLLYLVLLSASLRWFRVRPKPATRRGPGGRFARWYAAERRRAFAVGAAPLSARGALVIALLLVMAALATSHQLSPIIATVALGTLAVTGLGATWNLTAIMSLATAAWIAYGAAAFMGPNMLDALREAGNILGNTESGVLDMQVASPAQAVVSWAGRALTAGVFLLAGLGMLRRLLAGRPVAVPALLAAVPVFLVAGTSYGGEILFRVYLFALPFLGFFAASLLLPSRASGAAVTAAVSLVCLAAFLLAHFGKDEQYRFGDDEIEAAQFLYENAPAGALIIEGDRNYPSQFLNYERFTYVALSREDPEDQAEILADPASKLDYWADNPNYTATYVILTRSQRAILAATGAMQEGALTMVEQALRRSTTFDVAYDSDDAVVFRSNRFRSEGQP